jgi:hypothetical protein
LLKDGSPRKFSPAATNLPMTAPSSIQCRGQRPGGRLRVQKRRQRLTA